MSKDRMMKCPICEKQVPRSESIKYKNRYHHEECYSKRKAGEPNEQKRMDLIDYILELYNMKSPSGMMLKQIKDFNDKNGYTYEGMRLTLWYFHEIKGNPIKTEGIGIIPYVYNEARDFFIRTMEARKHMEELKENGLTELTSTRTVKVKPKHIEIDKKKKIDISDIE